MSSDDGHRENVASHRIADSLRTAILDGSYLPGARIRRENVAASSGASRIPVREALRMLDSEGLVTLVANAGAWVTKLSLRECVETYLIRERLEPLLLRTSMPRLDAAAVDRLGGLADEMEAGAELDAFMRTDREFHLSSYAGAESSYMSRQIIHRMWNTTQHYRREFTRLAAPGILLPLGGTTPLQPPGNPAWASRTWSTACCSTASAGRTRTTPSGCW